MKVVHLLAVSLPVSLMFWLITYFMNLYNPGVHQVSPLRFLAAILVPLVVTQWGYQQKSLNISGAIAGYIVGFSLTLSNLCFFAALLTFFVFASKATKFRGEHKRKLEEDFKEGGQRNWVQVFSNGGIASVLALLYAIDTGCTEKLIDFGTHYSSSWFSIAVLGALCCSCGDTFSSEIGAVVGRSSTARLITNFQSVPKGTNGGISLVGTVASFIGGVLVSAAYYLCMIVVTNQNYLQASPRQWPLIPVGGVLGLLGSTIDSVLGATVQYSGLNKKLKCIVNRPGPDVEHISGSDILDNHGVNLLSSILTALLAPTVAFHMWTMFT